jgi:hypothetical protein
MNVFLAGEGVDELGDWFHHPSYRVGRDAPGILESLLAHVSHDVIVADGRAWKSIRKYKAGDYARPETRNVLGLALEASESDCDVLVFARDRDGDPDREVDIERGIGDAQLKFPNLRIAGCAAAQQIEAWILGLLKEAGSEKHKDSKTALASRYGIVSRQQKVAAVAAADVGQIPGDAHSLLLWIDRARQAFGS